MKKKHTPVGKVLLAAAKVKKPASVGEKVTPNDRIAQRIANAEYDKHKGWWPLRTAIKKAIDAAVRRAAWDAAAYAATYLANHAVKDAKGIEVYEADFTAKYGPCPRPRSKR